MSILGLTTLNQAKVGREEEFEAALRRLRGKDANVSVEAAEIKAYIESLKDHSDAKILDLFESKYIRSVTIAVGLMIFQQIGGINGVGFYASETFIAAGMSSGSIGTIAYALIQCLSCCSCMSKHPLVFCLSFHSGPLLVKAVKGKPVPRPPAWMTRHAGRYMAVYRKLAQKHPSFRGRSEITDLFVDISWQP